MSILKTPAIPYTRFTDSNGLFIGELEAKADITKSGVTMRYFWVFNPVYKKSIEVEPILDHSNKITGLILVGIESRINYASRFIKAGSL